MNVIKVDFPLFLFLKRCQIAGFSFLPVLKHKVELWRGLNGFNVLTQNISALGLLNLTKISTEIIA